MELGKKLVGMTMLIITSCISGIIGYGFIIILFGISVTHTPIDFITYIIIVLISFICIRISLFCGAWGLAGYWLNVGDAILRRKN